MSSYENNRPKKGKFSSFVNVLSKSSLDPPKPTDANKNETFGEQSKFKETLEKFNSILKNYNEPPKPKGGNLPKRPLKRQHSFHFNKSRTINSDNNKKEFNNNSNNNNNNSNISTLPSQARRPKRPLKRVQSMNAKFSKIISSSLDSSLSKPPLPPKPKFNERPTSAPRPHRQSEYIPLKISESGGLSNLG